MTAEAPICRFYRLIPGAPEPQRADRSADGTLPVAAYRYCEPITSASGFGWYLYPPITLRMIWIDGNEIIWTYDGAEDWYPLRAEQFPDFPISFERIAPNGLADLAPTFVAQGKLPGVVQIWSGYLASTLPGWALLSRGPANLQSTQPYVHFEGIFESDDWLGPLFTSVQLKQINSPIEFHVHRPLLQLQPIRHESYQKPSFEVLEATALGPKEWRRFEASMVPNTDMLRKPGHYAAAIRRRQRGEGAP